MSKKFIAGAGVVAGLAVALAPLATFAEGNIVSQTDTLRLILNETCNIAVNGGIAHTAGTGTWTGDTLEATVLNGTTYANLGKTAFKINCTGAQDWIMAVDGNNLMSGSNHIDFAAASANSSYWNLTTSQGSTTDSQTGSAVAVTGLVSADGNVATGAHVGATGAPFEDTFTVTYAAGISDSQAAGTYEGTAIYTLTPSAHSNS